MKKNSSGCKSPKASMKATKATNVTVGMDLGDKTSRYCMLDENGEVLREASVGTTKKAMTQVFATMKPCRVAIEVGTHSPWVSRLLKSFGHEVIVANARQVQLISKSSRKNDRMDAQMLARLVRVDPRLLRPIQHRSEQAQEHLRVIRVRAALVEARTMLVNAARGLTKATGERLASCDADQMVVDRMESLPAGLQNSLRPLLEEVESLTEKIQALDQQVEQIARTDYPETDLLRQVSGVGPLIALTFVLTVEDRERFQKTGRRGLLCGFAAEAERLGGERTPTADHQGRGSLSAEAAGAGGALHYGAARTGYGSKALGVEVKRTWWQERQEAGRGGSGSEAGDSAASVVGNWGSVRTVAEQPGWTTGEGDRGGSSVKGIGF